MLVDMGEPRAVAAKPDGSAPWQSGWPTRVIEAVPYILCLCWIRRWPPQVVMARGWIRRVSTPT